MQLAGIHCFCRMFIWRSLLKLPENHAAYSSLVDKGTHTAFARLHEEYPIKSRKLLRVLQRFVLTSNNLHKPYTPQTTTVPNFRERQQNKHNARTCVKISSREDGETLSLACVAPGFVTTSASFHRYCFVFLSLRRQKQHSFTPIPLTLKATLPSICHLRRELRFTSRRAFKYVARFTILKKKIKMEFPYSQSLYILIMNLQWNLVNTVTNEPKKFGRVNEVFLTRKCMTALQGGQNKWP